MGGVRRSGRIAKEIRILLLGTDTSGRVFSEETRTVVLSRHGAGILSTHKLAPDESLTLRVLGASASTEAAVRLVGPMGEDGRGYTYGVAFADPELDFWQIDFPPPSQWVGNSDCALECILCHTSEVVHQSEIEADVYALARGILRFCEKCGNSTTWCEAVPKTVTDAPADGAAKPTEPVSRSPATGPAAGKDGADTIKPSVPATGSRLEIPPSPDLGYADKAVPVARVEKTAPVEVALAAEAAPPRAVVSETLRPAVTPFLRAGNRRRDVRTRVSFMACIRQGDAAEEIVECDNVSRGGMSFRSRKSYALDSVIEVAAPYAPGWHAIFVTASIRRVETLPDGALFRYGVGYKPRRKSDQH